MQVRWECRPFATPIADHDDCVVDAHLGVHDGTIGHVVAAEIGSAERVLQEVDHALGTLDHQVR